jgi:RNA polymerase sigma factor (sigma-70 family)
VGAGGGELKRQESTTDLPGSIGGSVDAPALGPGCSEALAQISRNHHAALVRFLSVRTGSVEDAKDIVQEAFTKMLALGRPGTVSFLAAYLWRVAVNLAVDRGRQRALHERYMRALPQGETKDVSAEATVEARERLAIVERAIGNLPPRCLEAFVLHVLNGRTFDEVGREMGICKRVAQKYVARALEYLHSCLDAADEKRSSGERKR